MYVLASNLEEAGDYYFSKIVRRDPITILWLTLSSARIFSSLEEAHTTKELAKKCNLTNEVLTIYEVKLEAVLSSSREL